MARRMANKEFRDEEWRRRYDMHIAPINRLVDDLNRTSEVYGAPYVPPMYGGITARLLSVLRDPGPKTNEAKGGSGFICMENDDPTAEALCSLFAEVGIDAKDIVPWNIYPWYINRAPSTAELDSGVEPLKRLIDMLPNLRVVMLHGCSAHGGWKRFARKYHDSLAARDLHIIETYHTSRQAFWHRELTVREARKQQLQESFREAARLLGTV